MSDIIRPNTPLRVEGAATDAEAAQAIVAGVHAPEMLYFDPQHPAYDHHWCRRLRAVYLNQVELTDVVGFDIRRGEVEVLLRDEKGKERHTYEGPKWWPGEWPTGKLRYLTAFREPGDGINPGVPYPCPCGCGRSRHIAVTYGMTERTYLDPQGPKFRSIFDRPVR